MPLPRWDPLCAPVACFPIGYQPSPSLRRVGSRIARFEACPAFTLVPACLLAEPPSASKRPAKRARRLPNAAIIVMEGCAHPAAARVGPRAHACVGRRTLDLGWLPGAFGAGCAGIVRERHPWHGCCAVGGQRSWPRGVRRIRVGATGSAVSAGACGGPPLHAGTVGKLPDAAAMHDPSAGWRSVSFR